MSKYKTNTKLPHEREACIKEALKASTKKHTFHEYQNKPTELPEIRIDITVPIYRMANYRTRTAQLAHIRGHGESGDFFAAGEENESAQQAQHHILVGLARQGRSTSISPIMSELETEKQREPLLITTNGVVVNGNRRLAAMRELHSDKPENFRHFSHVDCAVLPTSITPDEVREIEVRLQMRPETKLPYGWIEESMAIQDMIDNGRTIEYVMGLMKKKKKDLERAMRALNEVDIYLQEWLNTPGEYKSVEDNQQFFNDLAKALDGVEGAELEARRRIAWVLVSNSRKLGRRIYDYNFSFNQSFDDVVTRLSDGLDIDISTAPSDGENASGSDDGLEIELGDSNGADRSLDSLIEAFDDTTQREKVTTELEGVCDTIIELKREGEVGRRALAMVQAANKSLQEVDISKADPETYSTIASQLGAVKTRAESLSVSLESYKDNG